MSDPLGQAKARLIASIQSVTEWTHHIDDHGSYWKGSTEERTFLVRVLTGPSFTATVASHTWDRGRAHKVSQDMVDMMIECIRDQIVRDLNRRIVEERNEARPRHPVTTGQVRTLLDPTSMPDVLGVRCPTK